MLIYHPAYDAYHCVFRLLALSESITEIEIEKARILDFYLVFPSAITEVKLPRNMTKARKAAISLKNIYHDPSSNKIAFQNLWQIQDAALQCLVAAGLFDIRRFESGLIARTEVGIKSDLKDSLSSFMEEYNNKIGDSLKDIISIPLWGKDGLKGRTGLMEFRYDFN